jgi:hypothetical protein
MSFAYTFVLHALALWGLLDNLGRLHPGNWPL